MIHDVFFSRCPAPGLSTRLTLSWGGTTTDFLESESIADGSSRRVPLAALWHVLVSGLASIWPTDRTTLGGVPLGDVWPCDALKIHAAAAVGEGDELVPFHKLTGWTTYSLIEPIEKILGWKFDGLEDMTGLPEYRNGACRACGRVSRPASLWSPCSLTHALFFFGWLAGGWVDGCVCVCHG